MYSANFSLEEPSNINSKCRGQDGFSFSPSMVGNFISDLAQYLYAKTQRCARELLEQRGALPPRKEHQNGAKWIFWAEEPKADADN
jgi:hypothetical protein